MKGMHEASTLQLLYERTCFHNWIIDLYQLFISEWTHKPNTSQLERPFFIPEAFRGEGQTTEFTGTIVRFYKLQETDGVLQTD